MTPTLYAAAIAATVIAGTTAWALLERHDAGQWRERAATEAAAGEAARLAAKANAATAIYERDVSASLQVRVVELEKRKPEVEFRTQTIIREVMRASDAYSPAGAALRLAARRLRELDATGPGAARPDATTQAGGAPGDPAAAGGSAGRRPRLTNGDLGAYAVQCLGHVIKLEYQIQALDLLWDDMEKALAARRAAAAPH